MHHRQLDTGERVLRVVKIADGWVRVKLLPPQGEAIWQELRYEEFRRRVQAVTPLVAEGS